MLSPLAAAASSTSRRNGFPTGGRIIGNAARRPSDTGSGPNSVASPGTSPTSASSRRCSTSKRGDVIGSVTTAWPSSPARTSEASRSDAPSLMRSCTPGASDRRSATSAGIIQRLAVPTMPRLACPVRSPCSIDRSACMASSSRRIRRARSRTAAPHSVGIAPRRPRTSRSAPSSSSSWRTCSDTFDWTVDSTSAAAVKDPCSAMASKVSRCRSSIAEALSGRPCAHQKG